MSRAAASKCSKQVVRERVVCLAGERGAHREAAKQTCDGKFEPERDVRQRARGETRSITSVAGCFIWPTHQRLMRITHQRAHCRTVRALQCQYSIANSEWSAPSVAVAAAILATVSPKTGTSAPLSFVIRSPSLVVTIVQSTAIEGQTVLCHSSLNDYWSGRKCSPLEYPLPGR